MKRFIILCVVTGSVMFGSCNSWLDVMPAETTSEKQIFETYSGYRAAVNGIYQSMSDDNMYGLELTWGFASALSQYINNATTDNDTPKYTFTEQYDFSKDEVRNIGEAVWQKSYNIIANCNNFIQHIEKADKTMFPNQADNHEVEMMTGEIYAVRALLHFELLRLFAPSPAAGMDEMAIPYNDHYPTKFAKRQTIQQVIDRIVEDLEYAYPLVALHDTRNGEIRDILAATGRFSATNPQNAFFSSRGYRMNSVAIQALLARVHMYAGNLSEANSYASGVYALMGANSANNFYYTTYSVGDQESTRSHKMMSEVIFGAYRKLLTNYYANAIFYSTSDTYRSPYFLKNVEYMYQTYRPDNDDYRGTSKLISASTPAQSNKRYVSIRYKNKAQANDDENCLIPVIRMSEMRYIMAEYLAKEENDIAGAVAILNDHRVKRGCLSRSLSATMSLNDFMDELLYDQWKEFTMEGQYFFQCKRLNLASIKAGPVPISMNAGKYTLAIPYSETSITTN